MEHNRQARSIAIALLVLVTVACLCIRIPPVRPELKFAPDSLLDARVGVPYQADIFVAQNETPVGEFWISAGSLPRGLSLEKLESEDVARISGTPEEAGSFTFTVSVWCYGTSVNGQSGSKSYTLVVEP